MDLQNTEKIESWLRETSESRLDELWTEADRIRKENVGEMVHLRGLIEISNYCVRSCQYCGLHAANPEVERYRMDADEILACAKEAVRLEFGTVVIQAGEDYGVTGDFISGVVRRIKDETPLAVTLSLGEREDPELIEWKKAGADRYLLRFETGDPALYERIHPSLPGRKSDRIGMLRRLREFGYEIGSGIMIGIPGQSYTMLARDIELFRDLDLDMIGVGPYISHPATGLGSGKITGDLPPSEQVPADEHMTYKVVALARLMCPQANIPSTTALATLNKRSGREYGLRRGANIVMPNVTPAAYRVKYLPYPGKACLNEVAEACNSCLRIRIESIGRTVGTGKGGRIKRR